MTSYCSLAYLVLFLPVVVLLYSVVPQRTRPIVLLLAGAFFYWCFSGALLIFLLCSTTAVFLTANWLARNTERLKAETAILPKEERKARKAQNEKKRLRALALTVVLVVGVLLVLKYTPFTCENVNALLALCGTTFRLTIPKFLLPLGLSFYTLQAVAYLFDVYRGKIRADHNFLRLLLFMSFFPQLMEGPICRYDETASPLWSGERITYENLTFGVQRILFGVMKKVVIADRLNLMIQTVFDGYLKFDGGVTALAMIGYTCQLYMEFSGTMDIVIGTGEIFGVRMPENFRQPFFSRTISDFWSRWHITLGTFFRDYIFYPLSMSKPLKKLTVKARRRLGNHYGPLTAGSIALFCVWFCNGLWHGSAWQYLFFGMYHFALILTGNLLEPVLQKLFARLKISRTSRPYHVMQVLRTVLFVNIGELFFRADGYWVGLYMFKNIFGNFTFKTLASADVFKLGMDAQDFTIVLVAVAIVLALSILREKGVNVRRSLAMRPLPVRWSAYCALILFLIVFGAYGVGYVPIDPIYANF